MEKIVPVPSEWNLTGKSVILTSDGRGWTPHFSSALAEAGANVAIAGSQRFEIDESVMAVEAQGQKSLGLQTDLTKFDDVVEMVCRVVSEFGGIDVLVNNVCVDFGKPFIDVTESEWQSIMDFNLKSMFLCCQQVGKQMLQQGTGRIINIGSGLASRGLRNSAVLCASQGGVRQLTLALALEWARDNIRVNAIGSGWMSNEPRTNSESDFLDRFIPLKRKGHPTDLCGLLVYLASDSSDFVTGQMLYVDGGAIAHA